MKFLVTKLWGKGKPMPEVQQDGYFCRFYPPDHDFGHPEKGWYFDLESIEQLEELLDREGSVALTRLLPDEWGRPYGVQAAYEWEIDHDCG